MKHLALATCTPLCGAMYLGATLLLPQAGPAARGLLSILPSRPAAREPDIATAKQAIR